MLHSHLAKKKKNHCSEPLSNVHIQYNHNFQPKVKVWKKENKKRLKNAVTLLAFVSSPQRGTNSILLQVKLEKDKPVVWLQYKLLRSNNVYDGQLEHFILPGCLGCSGDLWDCSRNKDPSQWTLRKIPTQKTDKSVLFEVTREGWTTQKQCTKQHNRKTGLAGRSGGNP